MLFRRRVPLTFVEKIRAILWPRKGIYRVFKYIGKRILHMPGSAYSLAAGAATGVAVSLTPFIGFHLLLIAAVCYVLRANMVVGFITSLICNPWTFWFLFFAEMETGKIAFGLLGFESLSALNGFADIKDAPILFVSVWTLGGLIMMSLSWPITFGLSYYGIKRWRYYRQIRRALKFTPQHKGDE